MKTRGRQMSHQMWIWGIHCEETSPGVQNRGISGPTKRTYVLQIVLKKINEGQQTWKKRYAFSIVQYEQTLDHFLRSAATYYAPRSNAVYFWQDIFTIELIRRIYSPRFQGFVQPWHSIEFSRNTQSWQCWHFCTISNGNRSTLEIVDSWINFSTHWQLEFILKQLIFISYLI